MILSRKNYIFLFIVLVGVLYLFNLGSKGLWSSQEARNALAARCMINGELIDWIMPEIAYERSTQKPVLFYWLVALSCIIGKTINSFYVRLPAALSGLLCSLYLLFFCRKMFSFKTGVLVALVLSTSIKFLKMSRTSRIDIFLTLCLVVTLCEFYKYYVDKRRLNLYTGYFFSALAVLSKGPVGIVLPAGIMFVFLFLMKDLKKAVSFFKIDAVIFFIVLVLPYYLLANKVTGGTFFYDFIIRHNIERFTGAAGTFGNRKPIWFYIPHFIGGSMPWIVFGPLLFSFYRFSKNQSSFLSVAVKSDPSATHYAKLVTFFTVWFFVGFAFFSLASFKRSDYILPVFPAFAVIMGICLSDEKFLTKYIRYIYYGIIAIFSFLVLSLIILFTAKFVNLPDLLFNISIVDKYFNNNDYTTLLSICDFARSNFLYILLFAFFLAGLLIYLLSVKVDVVKKFVVIMCSFVVSLYIFYFYKIEPALDEYASLEPFSCRIKEVVDTDTYTFYKFWNHSLAFYLDTEINSFYVPEEFIEYIKTTQNPYFIVERKWFNRLPEEVRSKCVFKTTTGENHRKQIYFIFYDSSK